ncbi:endopeptidase La [Ilyobacter polytropus]|uniref:Lon protease n=1 Tax=Ilyobacter polytropus (strain ATCC 51220 / DSM 2926 / LMG 16218 / CuHBu1) TaxID=572544 RepID=E3H6F2_ILYPC|nr:endopeptidase La [Ilyobacter polytropus]ADO82365.1 ATP-dependent protease La [Ilyobacter polytropus DSM 2926]
MIKTPFIPTRDLVIFPGIITPLFVGREISINSLEKAMLNENKIVLCMQKDFLKEEPELPEDVHSVGVLANVLQTVKMPNNTIKVLVEAQKRITLKNVVEEGDSYFATYKIVETKELDPVVGKALYRKVIDIFEKYAKMNSRILPDLIANLRGLTDIEKAFDLVASNLQTTSEEKQKLLETFDTEERGYLLIDIISKEIEIAGIEKKIDSKVKEKMNQAQKSYYLKEKINAMKDELGENFEDDDIAELKEKIKKAKLPQEAKKKVEKELSRLTKMPAFSAESTVSRTYIETIAELPWNKKTKDILDVKKAHEVLEADHYGLKEVKERILEYLSVKKLNPGMKGSILCLVGPPGVGKTSLAKSIASAMGRKFARVSLGGVRDEADIRGHRRTYIGSMPGRIIRTLKDAQSKNPLVLLDEIDKMSSDFKGDPASAMLEVLDPEQNKHFEDHYVDMPFDLSDVFFIATANDLRTIPAPLRDRMDIISLSSYTEYEKLHIAKRYLIEQAKNENGLNNITLELSDRALMRIIDEYTREAGVRTLKREISRLFRRIAKEIVDTDKKKVVVNIKNLEKYMGKVKFRPGKMREKEYKVGVVNGLAWTAVGGTTLEVQGVSMPGKGKLSLTGTLGNVMKESAHVAYTFVRAKGQDFGIEEADFNEKKDIHLHFPEGATPKDGPSAGITITTTIISILSGRGVRQDLAMTGEITITGEVLAVGGIKEKVIGAHRVGIREVILPAENESDVSEIPSEVSKDMKFNFVKNYEEVEKLVFEK